MAKLKTAAYFAILASTPLLYSIVNRKEIYPFFSEHPVFLIISLIGIPILLLVNALFLLLILIAVIRAYVKQGRQTTREFGIIWKYRIDPLDAITGAKIKGFWALAHCPKHGCGRRLVTKKPKKPDGIEPLYCIHCSKEYALFHNEKQIGYNDAAYIVKNKLSRFL